MDSGTFTLNQLVDYNNEFILFSALKNKRPFLLQSTGSIYNYNT